MFKVTQQLLLFWFLLLLCVIRLNSIGFFNVILVVKSCVLILVFICVSPFWRFTLVFVVYPLPTNIFGNFPLVSEYNTFNIGLNNVLAVSHPTLLISAVFFTYWVVLASNSMYSCFFPTKIAFFTTTTSLLSVFLGSFWSNQEVFWDGFWNWDFIEFSIVFIFICLYLQTHTRFGSLLKKNRFLVLQFSLKLGVITPFLKSVHSFSGTPLMFLSSINTTTWLATILLMLLLYKSHLFLFFKLFLLIFFVPNYSVYGAFSSNLFWLRNLIYSWVYLCFLIKNKKILTFFFFFLTKTFVFYKTHTSFHWCFLVIVSYYLYFFSLTVVPVILVNQPKLVSMFGVFPLSVFGGYKSNYIFGLEDTFNIYFRYFLLSKWCFFTPSLSYKTVFIS